MNIESVVDIEKLRQEKGNVSDLAKKLQKLCDDKSIVEKYRDGVDEFILSKYSWQDVARATAELYQK